MTISDFSYSITNPYVWGVLFLIALRAIYKCIMDKDYPHLFAFIVVAIGALYMLGAIFGVYQLPEAFK